MIAIDIYEKLLNPAGSGCIGNFSPCPLVMCELSKIDQMNRKLIAHTAPIRKKPEQRHRVPGA
jgi:hypothetical protein